MIRESLILGTIWYALCSAWGALARSAPGRWFGNLCRRIGELWHESVLVNWFCSPRCLEGDAVSPGKLRSRCCTAYARLGLDRLMEGSIFLRGFLWCAAAVALAPVLPTMAVLALSLVGCVTVALQGMHERERSFTRNPAALPSLIYAALYIFGMLHSTKLRGSLWLTALTIAFLLFSLALYYAVDTREHFELILAAMVTAGAAVAGYGILQYFFGWGYQSAAWVDADLFSSISFRVGSTMENPNMLGQYLTLMIPLGGAKLLNARDTLRRLYYLACCGVMCICMVLTFSRGAWLGLMFAGLLFFIALEPRLIALAPIALAALYFVLPETVVSRFTSIGNMKDRSTSYRVSIWMGTLAMLRDGHWLLGVGPGEEAFNAVYAYYSYEASVASHSHNLFLQIVCDAGIAALIVFVWLILRCFRVLGSVLLRKDTTRPEKLTCIAFASGLLGFLVQAMTDYSFYNNRVMFLFWAYIALAMSSARFAGGTEAEVSA
ncbi:MAG: O-antigen ligase family protein [Oscillospiraceae bacterium]|nr:O-antigen ligase family protein [Oscillospiraceae bacterium]